MPDHLETNEEFRPRTNRHQLSVDISPGVPVNGSYDLGGLPTAVGVYLAAMLFIIGAGLSVVRVLLPGADLGLRISASISTGFLALEVVMLAAGSIYLLYPPIVAVVGIVGAALCWRSRVDVVAMAADTRELVIRQTRVQPLLLATMALALLLIVVTAIQKPFFVDELAYHWTSPLFWAHQHGFARSPYVSSNSSALAEHLYTFPALLKASTAAHWLDTTCWLALGAASASLARTFKAPPLLTAVSAIVVPSTMIEARVAYNDIFPAMFLVTGVAVILAARGRPRVLVLAGFVMAGAPSVKIFTAGAGLLLVSSVLFSGASFAGNRQRIQAVLACTLPFAAVTLFWFFRTYLITGHITDPNVGPIVDSATNPTLSGGAAAGRYPTILDIVKLPFVPYLTGIFGHIEPYGARTGIGLLVLLPIATVLVFRRTSTTVRAAAKVLVVGAAADWFVVAPVFPKVRFNLVVWTLLTVFAFSWPRVSTRPWTLALTGGVVLQLADIARVVLPQAIP